MTIAHHGRHSRLVRSRGSQKPVPVLVVDIVGSAGSGKSTIARLLNEELATAMLGPGSEASVGYAESERVTHAHRWLHVLTHPGVAIVAVRLIRVRPSKWSARKAFFGHLASLLRRSILLERATRAGQPFLVIPQGLVFQLRSDADEGLARVPLRLRPSAVVDLHVPPHERLARLITRQKPVHDLVTAQRQERGQAVYTTLRTGFAADTAVDLLAQWSKRFCSPQLSVDSIAELCEKVEQQLPTDGPTSTPLSHSRFHAAMSTTYTAGVPWYSVNNGGQKTPQCVVQEIRDMLLSES